MKPLRDIFSRNASPLKITLSFGMTGIYVLSGVYLLLKGLETLSPAQNLWIGILLVCYGIFRAVRVIMLQKEYRNSLDETVEE